MKSHSVIYDIGANTSCFSLLAAQQYRQSSRVVAFEPVPVIVNDLRAMMVANGFNDPVHTCWLALFDSVGRTRMYTPASARSGIIQSEIRHEEIDEATAIDVDMSTLDNFSFVDGNPVREVVKLDVEGAEASVLAGAM